MKCEICKFDCFGDEIKIIDGKRICLKCYLKNQKKLFEFQEIVTNKNEKQM